MLSSKKGVSLVEVMIALVILLFVFLALMQTALVSIDANLKNTLRDEAVGIAEARMTVLRSLPFDDALLADTGGAFAADTTVSRAFRNMSNVSFVSTKQIDDLNTDNKQMSIRISWGWKGETLSHTIATVVRRQ